MTPSTRSTAYAAAARRRAVGVRGLAGCLTIAATLVVAGCTQGTSPTASSTPSSTATQASLAAGSTSAAPIAAAPNTVVATTTRRTGSVATSSSSLATSSTVAGTHTLVAPGDALCAAAMKGPHGGSGDTHCRATQVKQSSVDAHWIYGIVALYDAQGAPASDQDEAMLNLVTHQLIGPTSVGMCGAGQQHDQPIGGYGSIPAAVLASLGLHPCAPSTSAPTLPSPAPAPTTATTVVGGWGAHESSLTITASGHGHLMYADITKCPSCSMASAPLGVADFTLRISTGGVSKGAITASSDTKVWAVGAPVTAEVVPGSPGQLLSVIIAGKQMLFCNATSPGQCGA